MRKRKRERGSPASFVPSTWSLLNHKSVWKSQFVAVESMRLSRLSATLSTQLRSRSRMEEHMSRPSKKAFFPLTCVPFNLCLSCSYYGEIRGMYHCCFWFLLMPSRGECRNLPLLTACEERVPRTSAKSHDSSRNGLYQSCIPSELAKVPCWGVNTYFND